MEKKKKVVGSESGLYVYTWSDVKQIRPSKRVDLVQSVPHYRHDI